MASIARDKNGGRRILFVHPNGKRPTIRLGKVSHRTAEGIKYRVEQLLEALHYKHPVEGELAQWVTDLEPRMAKKLAAVGLIANPETKPAATLGPFLQAWLAARKGDYKPASLIAWGQVINALTEFLGADCPLTDVTPAKSEAFRQSMLAAELRATTIHKRLQHARMFFAHAKRHGLVEANPFEFVRHRPGDASERRAYVPAADVQRAIEHAPNGTWKLLMALSRFAGLRVPSEALSLRWQDVDWERGRLTVPSPKTQHLAGRSYRVIPLFPAIRPYLEAAWDEAPEGAEYVMPEEYRRRAQGPAGWANANLRTTLEKVVRRAGLEPWPRLWHSMRASCETDLARQFPLAVVAKWLGNTQAVAMRHYVDVTDADFERATLGGELADEKAAQKAAQSERAETGCEPQAEGRAHEKAPVLQGSATSRDTRQYGGMEAAGIARHLGRDARNHLQTSSVSASYGMSCVPSKTRFWTAIRSKTLFLSDPSDPASTEGRELPPLNLGRINNAFPCLVADFFWKAGCRRCSDGSPQGTCYVRTPTIRRLGSVLPQSSMECRHLLVTQAGLPTTQIGYGRAFDTK